MSHTYELAAFIARRAEVDNQGISGVLQSLERRGFVERRLTSQTDMSAPREWRLKG
jgi:DNA-binding MarR family transcriptional regulator